MLIGLCSSLIFAPSFLHFNILLIEVIPIEAMEPVKQLDSQVSQEVPVQEPPAPATATSSTPSTTDTLTAYELEFLRPSRASSSTRGVILLPRRRGLIKAGTIFSKHLPHGTLSS